MVRSPSLSGLASLLAGLALGQIGANVVKLPKIALDSLLGRFD